MVEKTQTSNKAILTKLDHFIESYERDMRGDMHLNNGDKGIIGEIRDIKDHLKDYPSLSYLWHDHPIKLLGTGFGIFLIMYAVAEFAINGVKIFDLIIKFIGL